MALIPTTKINSDELKSNQDLFETEVLTDPEVSEVAFAELKEFFNGKDAKEDRMWLWPQFEWYCLLVWRRFSTFSRDVVVEAVSRQIPVALILEVDVLREIMRYLSAWTSSVDENDRKNFYKKIQDAFLASPAIVGVWQGKEVTVAELVKEIDQIGRRGNSMQQAEFESKLKQIMFPKNDPLFAKYITANPDEAVARFIDLTTFFLTVEPKDIWGMVDKFLNPEIQPATRDTDSAAPQKKEIPEKQAGQQPSAPRSDSPKMPAVPKRESVPTPAQIKSQIEQRFKPDANGQIENVDGVYAMLEELAKKYNDPKIAELYYFDASDNTFKWGI